MRKNAQFRKWERRFMRTDAHFNIAYTAGAWNAALRHALKVVRKEPDPWGQMDKVACELKQMMYK